MLHEPHPDSHLTTTELAAYLDRRIPVDGLDTVEAHLATCAECRGSLVGAQGVLAAARRPRRRALGAGLLVAAATILMFARTGEPPGNARPFMREGAVPTRLVAYGPTGETSSRASRFIWGALPGALSYRLTVTRADGAVLWAYDGADTVAVLPSTIGLQWNATHFWVTDALLADGTAMTTGLQEFVPVR